LGHYCLYLYTDAGNVGATLAVAQIGQGQALPLHFENETRKPNLNETIINEISELTGLRFTEEINETENTFAPIDILDYIYAILHSPAYREKYREFLKIDFPRVPYPRDASHFRALAALGAKLRRLHLMEGVEPQPGIADFPVAGGNEMENLQYVGDKVYINKIQYFDGVPPEAWNFYIGCYQPAQKWLKDRKGHILSYDDIRHYKRIIRVVKETGELMHEVDADEPPRGGASDAPASG
jgi:predicted helicase